MFGRGAHGAGPGDRLLVEEPDEQVELFLEERVVVGEVVAEQGERLGERAAGGLGDDLADRLGVGHRGTGIVFGYVAEGAEAEHEVVHRVAPVGTELPHFC
ncbi:hypothetical protein ABZ639_03035 [Saccharomonospora sp. NPDC006951]